MKNPLLSMLLLLFGSLAFASAAPGAVEWETSGALELGRDVQDVTFTLDGKWAYALTKDGDVRIYSVTGELEDTLRVGGQFDRIEATPNGERIYLTARANGTVKMIDLDFVQKFDTSGSPSKGPLDARVEIVAFNDFQ